MPNWCDTIYKCVGDLKEVKELNKALKYIDKHKTTIEKNGFGKWWLGNLVTKLGGDWEKYRCRGEITDYSFEDNVVTIYQSTAWCEQEGVRQCIEDKFPSIKVYYREEEPGCDVFYTNDDTGEYFPERYFLDCYEDSQYWRTIEEAAIWVSEKVGHPVEANFKAIEEALEQYVEEQENPDDEFYSFHEFQIAVY